MFGSVRPSLGLEVRNLKKKVKFIKMCGNLRDILNLTTITRLDYFM